MDVDDMAGILLVAFIAAATAWVVVRLFGPIAAAYADRIRNKPALGNSPDEVSRLRAEVAELRTQLGSRTATPAQIGGGDGGAD